jgi:hypothetical protein
MIAIPRIARGANTECAQLRRLLGQLAGDVLIHVADQLTLQVFTLAH